MEAKAKGELPGLKPEEIAAAKLELAAEIERLQSAVEGSNEDFPAAYSKTVVLIELTAAKQLLSQGDKGALARWLFPLLIFLAGAFAEGVIGVYAQRALEILERLSAN